MKKTAIVTAMREEAEHIIKLYGLINTNKLENIIIYENENIVLALAGIGKIQASIATTYLFINYDISRLINIGIAGSLLGDDANIGDVFIVNKISQHDMYLPFEGTHLDYAKKAIIVDSIIDSIIDNNFDLFDFSVYYDSYCLTGDQFIDDSNKVKELREKYSANVIEMEAFAIASVAREFNQLNKCVFIKAISDGANNEAKDAHMGNLDFAMQNSIKVLNKIIN
ncbi:MAG: 5'-methylthioadenosine/S-adenosylhomocysteine nucleosidase [Candidatus Gracilibacteria bacterium]|nr:5'-methylthioadenosine/S-adenosylhomocysteine nucleosidase [Candidatus Gracilibacteria bacterium]